MEDIPKPSFKGLMATGFKTPLVEFNGRLLVIMPATRFNNIYYDFNYGEIEVIQATMPYLFPTAVLQVKYSSAENSGWGILGDSYAAVLGVGRDDVDLEAQVGKMHHMVSRMKEYGESQEVDEAGHKKPIIGQVWEVKSLDGLSAGVAGGSAAIPTIEAHLLILLNGKNDAQFLGAALQDPLVKADPIQSQLIDQTWIPVQLALGKVVKDAATGIYTVIG